jgi:putative transposase
MALGFISRAALRWRCTERSVAFAQVFWNRGIPHCGRRSRALSSAVRLQPWRTWLRSNCWPLRSAITFRTHDSIPREVILRWDREKHDWLERHGYDARRYWSDVVPLLPDQHRDAFQEHFQRTRNDFLDTCHGECVLRRPDLAKIVADSLLHFDGQRYRMGDFIVMPNHVHLLAAFGSEEAMTEQCDSWLHYTAFRINRRIGRKGKFWEQEPFDHLVRSVEQYEYLRKYIAENGGKAGLKPGEYLYRRFEG